MPSPVSALDLEIKDLIREVSPEAITFYVDELSGIFLPDDFKNEHADVTSVKFWKPEDRLSGKFGRFALKRTQESDGEEEPLDDILVMGSTICVSGLDLYRSMHSLRHRSFTQKAREIFRERNLVGEDISLTDADYGSTYIKLDNDGNPAVIRVGGDSFDFGRATTEGRKETCEEFERLLGDEIEVVNSEPEPRERQQIVS